MKFSESKMGRIFIIRLEDRDKLPDALEKFAEDNNIPGGMCILVGGVRSNSRFVSGPADEDERPVTPIIKRLAGVNEILGAGTLFPGSDGKMKLHMHASMGRKEKSVTGCIRPGIEIWQVGEVILFELAGSGARREKDEDSGFELLTP